MSKTSQIIIAIVGVIILSLAGGYFGAGMRGGGGGAGGSENGAWIEKIKEQGELRVGIASAPPMTGEQEDGTMGGPNVLPLQNLAKELGVKFTPVAAEWSKMVSGLQADRFDVAAYLDATSERSLAIQFTDPVYTYEGVWIVKADSGLKSHDDIKNSGKPIAVASGTSYERRVQGLGFDIVNAEAIPQSITAMEAGRAVAAFGDLPTLADAAQKNEQLKIVRPDPVIFLSDSNYGVNPDIDARSLQVINIAIQNAKNDGSFEQALKDAGVISPDDLGDLEMK
ncbi:amino acid ABC transporter substrate-binding protein (PAAT family) [Brevibacterium sanguinis]|uniref:Amino acid ABC transporter substrate-binding protein (PAAT family) n=2 Tax=Brevibacterium TaxID=1696 RepID=A0A366IJP9_9MICO|nr:MULTISPECIES: transporter substrate-binding domain-containing protein [Brevibacterium]RBP65720.1 amino acid ABC transporter substrate-binding protein (PAAT family) [Brevibacterium sanguinis]RBP72354.1 amino acid ABC transporter substrate-binding protein (PAAT family) [Brevibacterium celere]